MTATTERREAVSSRTDFYFMHQKRSDGHHSMHGKVSRPRVAIFLIRTVDNADMFEYCMHEQ